MTDNRSSTADLAAGAVFFALAVAVIYGSWTMDRLEVRQIHPLTAPGLLPGLLGFALALCSVLLIVQALRSRRADGGEVQGEAIAAAGGNSMGRLAIAVVLCLTYALILIGRVPYWIATAIFVFTFIFLFEWRESRTSRQTLFSLLWALAIGLAAGLSISYAFSELFLVRLP